MLYFRVLKTGTRVENRLLDDADDLRECLAFDAVLAWRVLDVDGAARGDPEQPADQVMSMEEIQTLLMLLAYRRIRPRSQP